MPDFFSNNNIYKKVYDWSRFNKNSFLDDFGIKNWNSIMEIDKNNFNISLYLYIVIPHVPMKKLNKQQQKALFVTTATQNSIQRKNKLFKKYIKCQNPVTINDLDNMIKYKSYRNTSSAIIKESKRKYYDDYFSTNLKNIKNTWKNIKPIIS